MNRKVMISALVSVSGLACGQSLNLDINIGGTAGAGTPSASYGGAAGQAGHWDFISHVTSATSLRGLDTNFNGVTVTRTGGWGSGSSTVGGASSDFTGLMFDYGRATGQNQFLGLSFDGLDPGMYRVVVYAAIPGASGQYSDDFGTWYHMSQVSVTAGNIVQGFGAVGGAVVANTFQRGVTHFMGTARIATEGTNLTIHSATDFGVNVPLASINGVQLVKLTNRLYVDANATGAETGATWTNAIKNLQEALAIANASQGMITEIWVADGTYQPTSGTDRNATFTIPSGVKMYGGFAGGETSLSERPMAGTYLSGGIGSVFSFGDDSYHVVTIPNGSVGTVIDGFSIVYGNANGAGALGQGGGVYVNQLAVPTFRNCEFRFNRATQGGAVFSNLSSPRFVESTFRQNTATTGGAIYHNGAQGGLIPPYMMTTNCRIHSNTATGTGGGVVVANGDAMIAGSLMYGNTSGSHGGAVYVTGGGVDGVELTIANSTISRNHANGRAGGLYPAADGEIRVQNSIVWGNTATDTVGCPGACEQAYWNESGTIVRFDHCVLQGAAQFVSDVDSIDADPRFIDAVGGNYRLRPNSPAIDRAKNALIVNDLTDLDQDSVTSEPTPWDLDRNNRRVDAPAVADNGTGIAPFVDMGAYEFQPSNCAADLSGSSDPMDVYYGIPDGVLDASDFFFFLDAFAAGNMAIADLTASSDPNAPGYGVPDGVIDASDFFYYLDLFVAGCP